MGKCANKKAKKCNPTQKGLKSGCIACFKCCTGDQLLCAKCVKKNVVWKGGPWNAHCPNCDEPWTPEFLNKALTTDKARNLGLNAYLNQQQNSGVILEASAAPMSVSSRESASSRQSRKSNASQNSKVSRISLEQRELAQQRAEERARSVSSRSARSVRSAATRVRADSLESTTQEGLTEANLSRLLEANEQLAREKDAAEEEARKERAVRIALEASQPEQMQTDNEEEEESFHPPIPQNEVDRSIFQTLARCTVDEFGAFIRNNLIEVLEDEIRAHPHNRMKREALEEVRALLEKAQQDHETLVTTSMPRIQQTEVEVQDRHQAIENAMKFIAKTRAEIEERVAVLNAEKSSIMDSENRIKDLRSKAEEANYSATDLDPLIAQLERNLADLRMEKELLQDRITRQRRS
jgi:hypothetical protein